MTERMLAQFAAKPAEYAIEVDATAASYFLALPLVAGGHLNVTGLRILQSLQGDIEFVNVLRTAGLAVIEAGHGGEASIAKGSRDAESRRISMRFPIPFSLWPRWRRCSRAPRASPASGIRAGRRRIVWPAPPASCANSARR